MIRRVVQGNLLKSRAQTLVNTVNTVGVMGKGIALEFKRSFPEMYSDYEHRCRTGRVRLGEPYIFKQPSRPWIINFPTKEHWRSVSRLADIEAGLRYMAAHLELWGVESLAVPPLGCGNGQLEWRVVGPTIRRYLDQLPIPVELYAPLDVPAQQATLQFLADAGESSAPVPQRVRPEWMTIADVVDRIGRNHHAWPVGRVRLQKIAYFLTAAGVPTELNYARGSYGPFTSGMTQLISRMVNNGVLVERRHGRMLRVTAGATWPDAQVAYGSILAQYEPAIQRVTDLMGRLNDTRSEVVATVHFATQEFNARHRRAPSEVEVLREVMAWKVRRRPPLSEREVAEAIRDLAMLRWIDVSSSNELPIDDAVLVVA